MKKIITLLILISLATIGLSSDYQKIILKHEIDNLVTLDFDTSSILRGTHYFELSEKVTEFNNPIVVFFIYDSIDSLILEHVISSSDTEYLTEYSHATLSSNWHNQARLFYTLNQFGVSKQSMKNVFKMYLDHGKLVKIDINKILSEQGISHVQFWMTFDSLYVSEIFERRSRIEEAIETEGFPVILVKGKYIIKPWLLDNISDTNKIINHIMNK